MISFVVLNFFSVCENLLGDMAYGKVPKWLSSPEYPAAGMHPWGDYETKPQQHKRVATPEIKLNSKEGHTYTHTHKLPGHSLGDLLVLVSSWACLSWIHLRITPLKPMSEHHSASRGPEQNPSLVLCPRSWQSTVSHGSCGSPGKRKHVSGCLGVTLQATWKNQTHSFCEDVKIHLIPGKHLDIFWLFNVLCPIWRFRGEKCVLSPKNF